MVELALAANIKLGDTACLVNTPPYSAAASLRKKKQQFFNVE
jgi:hypothetical protein